MRIFPPAANYQYMVRAISVSLSVLLLAVFAAPVGAELRGKVEFLGGTVTGIPLNANGILETADADYLVLITRKATLKVLYERVNLLEYGQTVDRRYLMAVLISPVFALSKKRRHFLTVGFSDEEGRQQAILFRVDKNHVRQVLATLEARTGRKVEFQDEEARKAGRG
jgi:hypothetical protein